MSRLISLRQVAMGVAALASWSSLNCSTHFDHTGLRSLGAQRSAADQRVYCMPGRLTLGMLSSFNC